MDTSTLRASVLARCPFLHSINKNGEHRDGQNTRNQPNQCNAIHVLSPFAMEPSFHNSVNVLHDRNNGRPYSDNEHIGENTKCQWGHELNCCLGSLLLGMLPALRP